MSYKPFVNLSDSSWSHWLFWTLLVLTILLSFSLYSPVFYAGLNSDYALHALMAEDFRLPDDLYIWGENRIGSLMPILAVPLVKLGMTSLWAMSIVQYLFLLSAFFIWQSFFRSIWTKLALMFMLFIPVYQWQEFVMISHPVTIFVFFFGCLALLFKKTREKINEGNFTNRDFWILSITGILAIWSTEQLLVPLGLMWLLLLFPSGIGELRHMAKRLRKDAVFRKVLMLPVPVVLAIAVLKIAFIHRSRANFTKFVSPAEFVGQLELILFRLQKVLSFDHFIWLGCFAWACLGAVAALLVFHLLRKENGSNERRDMELKDSFFLWVAAALFLMTLFSKWVLVNFTEPRYFVPVVFAVAMFVLRKADGLRISPMFTVLMALGAFTAFAQNVDYKQTDDTIIRRRKLVEKLEITEPTGIIASYWFAYLSGAVHCPMALATVYPGDNCRNLHQIDAVFSKSQIILINNLWEGQLADTMHMYSRTLIATGPFQADGQLYYRKYTVLKQEMSE